MKLHIFTIVLDGMPFITWHLPTFNRLVCDWHWTIAEGAAMNVKDTAWCKPQEPRLSRDGTSEYLATLRKHPRVTVIQKQSCDGKVEMCNACLPSALGGTLEYKQDCVLMQIDCDELWTEWQLSRIFAVFEMEPNLGAMQFYCRYFVGQNIIITSEDTYGNKRGEWMRAWRWRPGCRFLKHEPPFLDQVTGLTMPREQSRFKGLDFEHYAYVLPSQVAFKENYYGYAHAGEHWQRLQQNRTWPTPLRKWLPWVQDDAIADRLWA